jgi:hypothetical protein
MRKMILWATAILMSVGASGIAASTGAGVDPAGAAIQASKAAFCGANDSIDRASASVNSNAGFLAVLRSHSRDLVILKKNAPSGALGQQVQEVVSDAEAAIESNNPNALNNLPTGGSIDTYCGVDGNGKPLPSYFGKGTTTAFCTTFVPVWQDTQNAPDKAGVLAILTAHQAQVTQLATELSSLPKSIKAKATAAVDKAQTAITTKNPSAIGGGNGNGPANDVALYCGQNQ